MKEKLTIGKLAQAAEVGIETIRFYERKELIRQPKKQSSFRFYPPDLIDRIKFIKRAQELGFTLKEVKELLDLKIKNQAKCSDVLDKTNKKILEINEKIKDLKKMKKSLDGLAKCCNADDMPLSECPILEHF
jgi:MerR family mercuric resistance operon transcriptional regulator